MTLYGDGRIALRDDSETADRLGWGVRKRTLPDPERVLRPRSGDPRREPWIAPPGWTAGHEPNSWPSPSGTTGEWTYLADAQAIVRYLKRLAAPRTAAGWRVAVAGMGRVGGTAAALLVSTPTAQSGIREMLILDADASNQERWLLELESIGKWRDQEELPRVRPITLSEVFSQCDVFLFVAAAGVPPLGTEGDVRVVQFEPNRRILRAYLDQARAAEYSGLFLTVSDPVDWLALASFVDSNAGPHGRFVGTGLAPERIAGLGLGVMWARALAAARREGWERQVGARGGIFGPHDVEVTAFDDLMHPSVPRSEVITRAARESNYLVRHLGFLPFVGPGVSSVGLTLPALLAGHEVLASVLVDGIYFGTPALMRWGMYPQPPTIGPVVADALRELHARLVARATELDLVFGDGNR